MMIKLFCTRVCTRASALALTGICLLAALGSFPTPGGASIVPSSPAGARTDQQLPEWTVMVFMDGDNNLEPFALTDFEEMARVSDSSQVNIVVQLDRIPGYSTKYGDWTNTLRFKVRNGMTPTPQKRAAAPGIRVARRYRVQYGPSRYSLVVCYMGKEQIPGQALHADHLGSRRWLAAPTYR